MKISKRHLRQVIREEYTRLKIRKLLNEKFSSNVKKGGTPLRALADKHAFKDITCDHTGDTNPLIKIAASKSPSKTTGGLEFLVGTYFDQNADFFKKDDGSLGEFPLQQLFQTIYNKAIKPTIKGLKNKKIDKVAANNIAKKLISIFKGSSFDDILDEYVQSSESGKDKDRIRKQMLSRMPRDGRALCDSGVLGAFLAEYGPVN
jgi:hypothetical protein